MSQEEGKPAAHAPPQKAEDEPSSGTYKAGCHCGYIKFSVTLTPPLSQTEVMNCNCSACQRFGYLLVCELRLRPSSFCMRPDTAGERGLNLRHTDPEASAVTWHNDSRSRCSNYRFNTKKKDQMFCKHCGASIGIDFREVFAPKHLYGISVSFASNTPFCHLRLLLGARIGQ